MAYLCAVAFCLSLAAIAAMVAITLWDEGPIGKVVVAALGLVDAAACGAVVLDNWLDRSPLRQISG